VHLSGAFFQIPYADFLHPELKRVPALLYVSISHPKLLKLVVIHVKVVSSPSFIASSIKDVYNIFTVLLLIESETKNNIFH